MKLGFIINPMAGLGGKVGLKGSDGTAIVEQALARGAEPMAGERSLEAMKLLAGSGIDTIYTVAGEMGEEILEGIGLAYQVVYTPGASTTSAQDTKAAVKAFCEQNIDLLVFAGGDGTARDVLDAVTEAGFEDKLAVVGIPAGVKIHSAVYAVSPTQAGELIKLLVQGQPLTAQKAEVMDLDEDAYRTGQVKASCYGYLLIPVDDTRMQAVKQGGVNYEEIAVQDIAAEVVENMEDDVMYFIGAGTTTAAVMNELGLDNTLLGVDVVLNHELVISDANEQTLLSLLDDRPVKIIVTAIGGQGHVFGRGNQQFSPKVLRKVGGDNIVIIATNEKLRSLNGRPLLVDTGDTGLDEQLRGVKQVVTGYEQRTLYKIN